MPGARVTIHRETGKPLPFAQQGLEARAGAASLRVDGRDVQILVPEVGIGGGPGAIWAPTGIYAR